MKKKWHPITGNHFCLCFHRKEEDTVLQISESFFQGGFATEIEIPYAEIESIKKCCVGGLIRIMPTGIKVTMKDGKKHYLSVLKRGQIMELIQSKIN